MRMKRANHSLNKIRRLFPNVTKVRDATKTITVRVKSIDSRTGRRKAPEQCALARACVRERIADGAIIGIGNSWLIKGNVATRYKSSVAVGREITSFDRHQEFAAGTDYKLSKVSPSCRMGASKWKPTGPHASKAATNQKSLHRTADIRVLSR